MLYIAPIQSADQHRAYMKMLADTMNAFPELANSAETDAMADAIIVWETQHGCTNWLDSAVANNLPRH